MPLESEGALVLEQANLGEIIFKGALYGRKDFIIQGCVLSHALCPSNNSFDEWYYHVCGYGA